MGEEKMKQTVRYSKKREAILKLIQSTTTHPSAEWLFQNLKPDYPDLSLGTIYRNLSFFQEQGVVKSVGVVQGQERFDATTEPHGHFVCTCCGKVVDLDLNSNTSSVQTQVEEAYGFTVQRQELVLYGNCNCCQAVSAS